MFRNPGLRKVNLALAGSVVGDWAYAVGVSVFAYSHGGATAVGVFGVAAVPVDGGGLAVHVGAGRPLRPPTGDGHRRPGPVRAGGGGRRSSSPPMAPPWPSTPSAWSRRWWPRRSGPPRWPCSRRWPPIPGELTAANVAASTIESVGFFAGPAIAGALLAFADVAVVFGFNALTFLWSAVPRRDPAVPGRDRCGGSHRGARCSGDRGGDTDDRPHSILHGAGAGFREIRRSRDLTLLVGLYCAQTVVAGRLARVRRGDRPRPARHGGGERRALRRHAGHRRAGRRVPRPGPGHPRAPGRGLRLRGAAVVRPAAPGGRLADPRTGARHDGAAGPRQLARRHQRLHDHAAPGARRGHGPGVRRRRERAHRRHGARLAGDAAADQHGRPAHRAVRASARASGRSPSWPSPRCAGSTRSPSRRRVST